MKKSKTKTAEVIGRRGTEETIAWHAKCARGGAMADRRTKRNRTRADQRRRAISED